MTTRRHCLFIAAITVVIVAMQPATADELSISGRITDENGAPLPGANVTLTGSSLANPVGAVAGTDGSYELTGVGAGLYDLEVSHIGYRATHVEDLELKEDSRQFDVALEEAVIYLEQAIVSASRTKEKALDAPASVSVVEAAEIRGMPVLSVSEHVRDLPGVDFAKNGLVQSNVVVRGFNNVFSGAMLTLTDNRLARVPSLRLNAHNFIPVVNEDIDRIEVVLGPGSALYGPNSSNGVMHIITRSPFNSVGTNVQLGMGERSLRKGAFRHAGLISPTLGYKISAQYYTGTDWKHQDPQEKAAREANPQLKPRDFDVERQSVEARLDYRPSEEMSAVLSAGYNRSDHIELTGLGAGQGINWAYNYVQARFLYRNLFAQVFRNWSDAGDTFLLNSGDEITDKSSLNVFQIQHAYELNNTQRFTYGFDALLTRPDTEGTITGQNEDHDNIDQYGAYVQSETGLSDQINLVLALRYDEHNRLKDGELSPRAGLVYKPRKSQTLRLTYNRAFSSPSTNSLYLDRLAFADPFGVGAGFAPTLGFAPTIDVRAQGTYHKDFDDGFTFRRSNGRPMFRTPFQPLVAAQLGALGLSPGEAGYSIQDNGYIAMDDPVAIGVMWGVARGAVLARFAPTLQQVAPGLIAQQLVALGMDADDARAQGEAQAALVVEALPSVIPQRLDGLTNSMLTLDTATSGFAPASAVFDVPPTKSTITQTLELGYKGIIAKKLVFAADAYRSDITDFEGALRVETPNVFLDASALQAALGPAFAAALEDPDNAEVALVLAALDQVSLPGQIEGNNNGSAVDELTALFVSGAGQIPFGTVSPEQASDPNAVIVTYRNYGDVTLYGIDLSTAYYASDQWTISGSYSFVHDDLFENLGGIADVNLNAPKHKFKLASSYQIPEWNLRVGGRARYNGAFPQNSGVWAGDVDSYTVVDLNAVHDLPFGEGLSLTLNIDNALDNAYRSFVGAPEIGRLTHLQLGLAF